MSSTFTPKIVTVFREGYTKKLFLSDLVAGLIVGIVALPLAIAFAIASGVKPEQGIYTAIIAGVVVSSLGGSRVQIAGPTGAFIVIVYHIVQTYGYAGLAAATLLAGIFLVAMGVARLGTLLKFVPYPLTVGFTSGIALIIFTSQLKDFFGLPIGTLPADFVEKWIAFGRTAGGVDVTTLCVGAASLAILLIWPRITRRIPGSLVAILLVTAAVQLFGLRVDTIGTRFGSVPTALPLPSLPDISWHTLRGVVSPAITIAMLGAIESLLSAVVADGMIRSRHRPNMELIAQGAANILSPIFGGIPATGAIARTATNIRNGGKTPVTGIIHAVVLLLILLALGRWATMIPMATLAAILIVVAYNMSEWRSFHKIFRSPRSDVAVMLVTFGLTVFVDLTAAIQVGVILSALFFIRRMAQVSQVNVLTQDLRDEGEEDEGGMKVPLPDGVEVFEIFGSLFFGAVDQFTEAIRAVERRPKVLILETQKLLSIDATGLHVIEDLARQLSHHGSHLIISGIHKQPLFALTNAGLYDLVGEKNICGGLEDAVARARELTAAGRG